MSVEAPRRASALGYLVGVLVLVGGLFAAGWYAREFVEVLRPTVEPTFVSIPGSASVELGEGAWALYWERPVERRGTAVTPQVEVTGPSGERLAVEPLAETYAYTMGDVELFELPSPLADGYRDGGFDGHPLGQVEVVDPGTYEVVVSGDADGGDRVALARPFRLEDLEGVAVLPTVAIGAFMLAALIMIVTFLRRRPPKAAAAPPIEPAAPEPPPEAPPRESRPPEPPRDPGPPKPPEPPRDPWARR